MRVLENIFKNIPFEISEEKKEEINKLEFVPLTRIRNDLTFKTFNKLFVLGRAPSTKTSNGKPITNWWCICSCPDHNIISVRVNNLTSGNTKSCGCQSKEASIKTIQEINQRNKPHLENKKIGNFLVLEDTGKRKYNSIIWKCKCLLCNNENYFITSNTLLNHTPKSCGCETRSKGIIIIENILNKNNLKYIKEKTFNTCRFPDTNALARFDFWVNNEFLIEYDGEQHFKEGDLNYFKDTLEKRQQHDAFKDKWCKENNIPLIRISYKELYNIKTLDDILDNRS